MDRNLQKNGLINLLALVFVGVAAYATARYAHSLAGQVATCFLGVGVIVAAVSWFHARLEEREHLEKLELDELAKGAKGAALFQTQEADSLLARRSREQFERYFVPGVAVALVLLEGAAAYFFWHW